MKNIYFNLSILSIIIAGLACKTASNSATKALNFNLEKGKSYGYEMTMDMKQNMMGQDSKINSSVNYALNVIQDSAGVKTLEGIYERFQIKSDMMGMSIDIDTDKPHVPVASLEENPFGFIGAIMKAMTGKPFTMRVDRKGNVLSVSGFENILGIFESIADSAGVSEDNMEILKQSVMEQYNDDVIKSQFSQVFTIFPDKEISIGDSWENKLSGGSHLPGKNTTTYTVKGIDGHIVTLATVTKSEGSDDPSNTEMEGSQTGNMLVDSRTGLVINAEYDQDFTIKSQGMAIQVKGKSKITGKEK